MVYYYIYACSNRSPALVTIFGDDACLQFGGGTLGHPWGNAPGAVAYGPTGLGEIFNAISIGGVATEMNGINYVSPRSWLSTSHFEYPIFGQ